MNTAKPINVWCFTDGKPGHEKQSLALIEGLKAHREVSKVERITCSDQSAAQTFAAICFGRWPALATLALPDIVIGTGRATHAALLAAKRCFGAKAVVIMRPSLPGHWYDCVIAPKHDQFTHHSLVEVDLALVPHIQRRPVEKSGLILLGGPSKHCTFDQTLVLEAISSLTANAPEIRWLISASRRTPESFLPLVHEIIDTRPNLTLVPLEQQDDNWLNERYQEAEEIWLTADSASMLAESIASGARVGVICLPLAGKKSHKLARNLDQLRSQHAIGSYERDTLTPAPKSRSGANDSTATAREVLTLLGI